MTYLPGRLSIALVMGLLVVMIAAALTRGYATTGHEVPIGTLTPFGSHAVRLVSKTPETARSGARVGDVLDFHDVPIYERFRFFYYYGDNDRPGATATIPFRRGDHRVAVARRYVEASPTRHFSDTVDIAERLLLGMFGVLLIARGRGRTALFAGLFLTTNAIATGFGKSFAGLPDGVAFTAAFVSSAFFTPYVVSAYVFAESLLAAETPPLLLWALRTIYVAGALPTAMRDVNRLTWLPFGDQFLPVSPVAFAAGQFVWISLLIVIAFLAFRQPTQQHRAAVRVVFWALLIGLSGPLINIAYVGLGRAVPVTGAWNLTHVAMAIGIAYAVFVWNLFDVDFFVSRALVYATVLSIVVVALILIKNAVNNIAYGHSSNPLLFWIGPIIVGISLRWIERGVSQFVERLFYREKLAAHSKLLALAPDFVEAHDPVRLAQRIAGEVRRHLQASCVVVYRQDATGYSPFAADGVETDELPHLEEDDPAFVRLRARHASVDVKRLKSAVPGDGFLCPIIVLGRLFGGVFVGSRRGERFDAKDQSTMEALSKELGMALLWLTGEHARGVSSGAAMKD